MANESKILPTWGIIPNASYGCESFENNKPDVKIVSRMAFLNYSPRMLLGSSKKEQK